MYFVHGGRMIAILSKEFGGWVWVSKFDPHHCAHVDLYTRVRITYRTGRLLEAP